MNINFRYVTHLDTFAAVSQLHKFQPQVFDKKNETCEEMTDDTLLHKTLLFRIHADMTLKNWVEDLPVRDLPATEKWPALKRLLNRARRSICADPLLRDLVDPTAPMGRVVVSVIRPGGYIHWHCDLGPYAKHHVRFHIPLVTNPLAFLYCRNETIHAPVGSLIHLNALEPHSAANWGDHPRSHLVFEMRRFGEAEAGGEVAG